jgi:hypothetical protein
VSALAVEELLAGWANWRESPWVNQTGASIGNRFWYSRDDWVQAEMANRFTR